MSRCIYCGGTSTRADRALAGKLICLTCGRPFVAKSKGIGSFNLMKSVPTINRNRKTIWILIFLVVLLIVML